MTKRYGCGVRTGGLRIAGRVLLMAVGSVLAAAGAASATPTWLAPQTLSATGADSSKAQIVMAPGGEAVAVWQRGASPVVQAAVRPAGRAWSTPATISTGGTAGSTAQDPVLAVDPQGNVTAAWWQYDGTYQTVWADRLPAGSIAWQIPEQLSVTADQGADPAIAVDPRGDVTAVWTALASGQRTVQTAQLPAGGAWSPPVQIASTPANVAYLSVATDPSDDAVVVWTAADGTSNAYVVHAADRSAGTWAAPVTVSPASQTDLVSSQVAMDAHGDAFAIWTLLNGGSAQIEATERLPGNGVWQTPTALSANTAFAQDPTLVVDPLGNVWATWTLNGSQGQTDEEPAGGTWQAPVNVSSVGTSGAPQLAFDASGDAVAVWLHGTSATTFDAEAATRSAGATAWRPPTDISSSTTVMPFPVPTVATDPAGDAAAIWTESDGSNAVVQAAGFDTTGPELDELTIPETGTVGVPVTFKVSPFDVWSAIASTKWTFGDGASGTGAAVSHTYARVGTYTVGVASTDAVGNAGHAAGAITIRAIAPRSPAVPSLTGVGESHRTWREGGRRATVTLQSAHKAPVGTTHKAPVGTTFSFAVNETVRAAFAFTQTVAGRKVSGRCRALRRSNRRRPACRLTLTRATLSYTVKSGHHRLSFDGRYGRHTLALGRYAVVVTAVNATTKRRSRSHTLRFTIVR
jgi:PKD domain